jgi:hypothetical protein
MTTKLDYRFLKVSATSPGLEDDGSHGIRVKVKADGGITLDSTGLSVDRSLLNEFLMVEHVITAPDVTAANFTLATPMANTNQIALTVYGGVPQNYGVDYTAVNSTTIGWTGLGLATAIAEGDEVQVQYPI